jgi:hypothetical protein
MHRRGRGQSFSFAFFEVILLMNAIHITLFIYLEFKKMGCCILDFIEGVACCIWGLLFPRFFIGVPAVFCCYLMILGIGQDK